MKTIARVFPGKTTATPCDHLSFIDCVPPRIVLPHIDEVHISVLFTWWLARAEELAYQWEIVAPVKIGGPAIGTQGAAFVPGMYVKPGYTITSRGCPNQCWFCSVWKREPALVELPIRDGWNVLDDNILACSERHIRAVFAMLERQTGPVQFTGGLEAKLLREWHVDLLARLRPKQMFFAYDTPDDYEPLCAASAMLIRAGFTPASHCMRCYVLIGHPRDTFEKAELRLRQTLDLGFTPMAMLWRDDAGKRSTLWMKFQRQWARPALIHAT